MTEQVNQHRRRLFGAATMTIAAAQPGMIGSAHAQSAAARPAALPSIKLGRTPRSLR